MEWHDDLAGSLPALRDDEPPDLRRRIIAEVRDHLHTAVQRELLRTGDAEQARQTVLVRFGDPARLARKLWYDAMWEKIMMQRWMLAALVAMVLISVTSTGLTCFLVVQAGQVNQALLEQNRAANEVLVAKLTALVNAPAAAGKSLDWNPLKIKLSLGEPGGAPAAGFVVSLVGGLNNPASPGSLVRTTGPDGIADFGLVKPGQHLLNIASPWGETLDDSNPLGVGGIVEISGLLVSVLPGEPQTQEIVCPLPPEETEISVAVDWPKPLAERPLWLVCDFVPASRELAGHKWTRNENQPRFLVVDPSGKLTNPQMLGFGDGATPPVNFFPEGEHFFQEEEMRYYIGASKSFIDAPGIYGFEPQSTSPYNDLGRHQADSPTPYGTFPVPRDEDRETAYLWLPKSAEMARLKWPAGAYSVLHIAVGCDSEWRDPAVDDMLHPEFLGSIDIPPPDEKTGAVHVVYPNKRQAEASRRKRRIVRIEVPKFEAQPGRLNEWRLTIPERLVDLLTEPKVDAHSRTPNDSDELPSYDSRSAPRRAWDPDDDDVRSRPRPALPDDEDELPNPRRRFPAESPDPEDE